MPLLADKFGLLDIMILLFILLGNGLFVVDLVSVQQKIALSFFMDLMISLSFPFWFSPRTFSVEIVRRFLIFEEGLG